MNWKIKMSAAIATLALTGLGITLIGCSTTGDTKKTDATTSKPKSAASGQSGATLWAQNCGHCHNIRSPDSYSDAQWDVAMLHMRVRANLTAEEHKQILAFIKSAH